MNENDLAFDDPSGRFAVVLTAGIVEKMFAQCQQSGMNETGGVLAGRYSKDRRTAVVTHLSGLPSDSKRGRMTLIRGVVGLKDWLRRLWIGRVAYYLGEWHYHPGGSPEPSGIDDRQMVAIARSKDCNCPEPVLIILGESPDGSFTFTSTVYETAGSRHKLHQRMLSSPPVQPSRCPASEPIDRSLP